MSFNCPPSLPNMGQRNDSSATSSNLIDDLNIGSSSLFQAKSSSSARVGPSEPKMSQSSSSATNKGKNHPSFTIILRKQLPVNFNISGGDAETGASGGNKHLNDKEEFSEQSLSCKLYNGSEISKPDDSMKRDFVLANSWQVWVLDDKEIISTDWNVKKHSAPMSTAREFWNVYSKIHDIFDKISLKNLMIFQDKIEPKWEDKSNIGGGRWYFDVSYNGRSEACRRECLVKQNYWTHCLETVLSGCLGEQSDLIVGLILHFKTCKYRVSLWIRSCSDFNQVIKLGASLRKCLNLRCQLKFELHSATNSSGSSGNGPPIPSAITSSTNSSFALGSKFGRVPTNPNDIITNGCDSNGHASES